MGGGVGAGGTVLVTARYFGTGTVDVTRILAATGYRVVRGSAAHDPFELAPLLAKADAWIAGDSPVTARLLEAARHVRVLARWGHDLDTVDLEAAERLGVVVTFTPEAGGDAVADHAVGMLLAALRGTVDGDRRVRDGRWTTTRGRELHTLSVGVVGYGRVGRGVARRLAGFGPELLVHDPFVTPEQAAEDGLRWVPLPDLAAAADAVMLHTPGGMTIVGGEWLDVCRPGQVVVNTARPESVDEPAVAEALRAGRLAAYAADTLTSTTGRHGSSPLLAPDLEPSVIITPRIGTQTVEAIDRADMAAANDVLAVLAGHPPLYPVPGRTAEQLGA